MWKFDLLISFDDESITFIGRERANKEDKHPNRLQISVKVKVYEEIASH